MLKHRVITALVLLAGLLAAVFLLSQPLWLALIGLVCAAAAWEWGGLCRWSSAGKAVFSAVCASACLAIGLLTGLDGSGARPLLALPYGAAALFWLLLVPLWLRQHWTLRSHAASVGIGLLVLVPCALAMAHLRMLDPWALLGAMALVWIADIAAYFTGRAFGRHKLAPAISPGKTWEGAGGALAGVLVFGVGVALFVGSRGVSTIPLPLLMVVLAVLTAISIEGDLFESLLKRQAGIKDSGRILPGHGGILDRIDSLTSTLPVVGLIALWPLF
jgi:phosphatidate cytidylyltransferase